MNKIRSITKNIAQIISEPAYFKTQRTLSFTILNKYFDKKMNNKHQNQNKQNLQNNLTNPIIEQQNLQYKLLKQSIRHGLSELVRIHTNKQNIKGNINYPGDYETNFIQSHFIHAMYLNRIGAVDYYFTIDDLMTTQSAYVRT